MADKTRSGGASLFDLRTVIAILFAFYGLVLTFMGIFAAGPETTVKSGGINLNLWTGLDARPRRPVRGVGAHEAAQHGRAARR